MPLEIRELVIKANIQDANQSKEQNLSEEKIRQLKKEITSFCLEKIEDKLNQKSER